VTTQSRILIVDDEMGIREGCKRALDSEPYVVDMAEDGEKGLEKIRKNSYDLILVDLMMPGISGLDLIKEVHQIDPEIIMIVITGFATIETAVEATKSGAYDYLPKPFSPEALIGMVKRGLEKRSLRLEAQRMQREREQRLLELASEKSRLQTIISCMADGVLVTNLEGRLVLWNASGAKMLKSKEKDKPGEFLKHYIQNKELDDSIQEVLKSQEKDISMISREIEVDKQGTVLMANIAPIRDEKKQVLGVVSVLRDITKLKEIEKIKSQFVSMVAHELRAPLAAIKGWLEVVISGEAGGTEEQKEKWLRRARDRSDSLLALVCDLLEINRMEAGKIAQKMESVHVKDTIVKIVEFLKPEIDKRGITVKTDFPKGLPVVQADPGDMEKLFTNLINNAIKYNKDKGSITIDAAVRNNHICFSISDTGIGISKKNLAHLFEDFFRADDDRIKKISGSGLGLTISKKIVDSHFGRFEVKSEPGEGSTFSVYLPLSKKESKKDRIE